MLSLCYYLNSMSVSLLTVSIAVVLGSFVQFAI